MIDQTGLIYSAGVQSAPPGFLRLAGHPVRWRLLTELAHTDRQVRELTGLLGQPQSLVSYHLGRLRAGGLVSARRSSADGRDSYYRIDLVRCRELLAEMGLAIHPGLALHPGLGSGPGSGALRVRTRVLFLCTGNSGRSQIAELGIERLHLDLQVANQVGERANFRRRFRSRRTGGSRAAGLLSRCSSRAPAGDRCLEWQDQ